MALVAVAAPTVEMDAVGYKITQTPIEVETSKLWALRQAAVSSGTVLIVVGDPTPDPGGPALDYPTSEEVQAMIASSLATFAATYPALVDALRVSL